MTLRGQITKLKRFLRRCDPDSLRQGLEIIRSLNDPELFDALLEGTTFEPAVVLEGQTLGVLKAGRTLTGTRSEQGWFDAALMSLIGLAPSSCEIAASLRHEIEHLSLNARPLKDRRVWQKWMILDPLATLPNLKSLALYRAEQIEGWAALCKLSGLSWLYLDVPEVPSDALEGVSVDTLFWMGREDQVALERASIRRLVIGEGPYHNPPDGARLAKIQGLKTLELRTHFADLSPLGKKDSLERVRIEQRFTQNEIEGWENLPLTHLSLHGKPTFERLPPLGNSELESIDLSGCTSLTQLPEMRGGQALIKLDLSGLSALERISTVSGLAHLRELLMQNCSRLVSLDGIGALKELQVLDLRGCLRLQDLSALSALKSLRVIAIHGANFTKGDLPEQLRWAASSIPKPNFAKLRARTPPKPKAPKKQTQVESLAASLWGKLRMLDSDQLEAGRIEAEAIDDPKVFLKLLKGCDIHDGWIELNARFSLEDPVGQVFRQQAFIALVAAAPDDGRTLGALKEKLRKVRLGGSAREVVPLIPACLRGVPIEELTLGDPLKPSAAMELPHLKKLDMTNFFLGGVPFDFPLDALGSLGALSELSVGGHRLTGTLIAPKLESLNLRSCGFTPSLFEGLPNLREVDLHRVALSSVPLAKLPKLERVQVSDGHFAQFAALADAPNIKTLRFEGHIEGQADSEPSPSLAHLQTLDLSVLPTYARSDYLLGATSLRRLHMRRSIEVKEVEKLSGLRTLESLRLDEISPGLYLREASFPSLALPCLRRLWVGGERLVFDLRVLSELPKLESLGLVGAKRVEGDLKAHAIRSATIRCDADASWAKTAPALAHLRIVEPYRSKEHLSLERLNGFAPLERVTLVRGGSVPKDPLVGVADALAVEEVIVEGPPLDRKAIEVAFPKVQKIEFRPLSSKMD